MLASPSPAGCLPAGISTDDDKPVARDRDRAGRPVAPPQCAHPDDWTVSCWNVMILTQVLATLQGTPRQSGIDIIDSAHVLSTPLRRGRICRTRELLGHFMNSLNPAWTRGMAAASVGEVVLLAEDAIGDDKLGVLEHAENSNGSRTDHAYHAFEVPYPQESVLEAVREEKPATSRTEQIRNILAAIGQDDVEAAENLVVLGTLPWIRCQIRDTRIFKCPDPPPDHLLAVLACLRPQTDRPKITFTVAADLWELPAGTTVHSKDEDTWTVSLSPTDVFRELESKLRRVFNSLRQYDEAATASKEKRLEIFYDFVLALACLDETAHNPVFNSEALFNSKEVAEFTQDHVHEKPWSRRSDIHDDEEDDDEPPTTRTYRLGMRVLYMIHKITQPIHSIHTLMGAPLRKLVNAGALRIYTMRPSHAVPRISVQDIIAFRAQFKITDQHEKCALDRLLLRAFFSRVSLANIAARHAALSDLVHDLDDLAERDKQAWTSDGDGQSDCSIHGGKSAESGSNGGTAQRSDSEKDIGSTDKVDMFNAMWDAITNERTSVRCTASRHAESLLMVALHTAKMQLPAEQVYAATRTPCFCCKWVSETLDNSLPPTHGLIFPWVPPCGLALNKLQRLERILTEKLKGKMQSYRSMGTTASTSNRSS
ncbi:hypothetical protein FB451DRAFT_1217210 [Mycena latifolia]|nr:hypothetical protein FB451DRAFT_1217210 [Mycena latifolia]